MANITFENNADIDSLLASNPQMAKKVQKIIKTVLTTARKYAQNKMAGYVPSTRKAYETVKKVVYGKILGGNLNILRRRYRSGRVAQVPPQRFKLETEVNSKGNHRGGNRMKRSAKTERMMSYAGSDRYMVLGWLNSGTAQRTSKCVNRGSLYALNFFNTIGEQAIEQALSVMSEMCEELVKEFNKK